MAKVSFGRPGLQSEGKGQFDESMRLLGRPFFRYAKRRISCSFEDMPKGS